jgi:hypothetical protein
MMHRIREAVWTGGLILVFLPVIAVDFICEGLFYRRHLSEANPGLGHQECCGRNNEHWSHVGCPTWDQRTASPAKFGSAAGDREQPRTERAATERLVKRQNALLAAQLNREFSPGPACHPAEIPVKGHGVNKVRESRKALIGIERSLNLVS